MSMTPVVYIYLDRFVGLFSRAKKNTAAPAGPVIPAAGD